MFLDDYEQITDCIVIDTETVTDEITRISKVWEIGIVRIKNEQIVDRKEIMISPDARFEKLDIWYPDDINTIKKIRSSPKFADIYEEIKEYMDPNAIICGHNTDYDVKVINRELAAIQKDLIGNKKIDTIKLARKVHPDWIKYNLDAVCKEYDLEIEKRHRALDDAFATAVAYLKMREKLLMKNTSDPNDTISLF